MGIFDRFKKKEKETEKVSDKSQEPYVNMPAFRTISDGRLQAEYYNGDATQREFYDTTKLTIDTNHILDIGGQHLYNCVVAWDSVNDCIIFDEKRMQRAEIAGNRDSYKGVWLDLDLAKLQTDSKYCEVLMNKLLLKSRVESLINKGLQENPDRPCGKYIGGVIAKEDSYIKFFSERVGHAAHQTPFMQERRAKLRLQEKEAREARIEANKRKMAELIAENESLMEKD